MWWSTLPIFARKANWTRRQPVGNTDRFAQRAGHAQGTHKVAKSFADLQFETFNMAQIVKADKLDSDFDRAMKLLPKPKNRTKK
jgi:hypothetical protein